MKTSKVVDQFKGWNVEGLENADLGNTADITQFNIKIAFQIILRLIKGSEIEMDNIPTAMEFVQNSLNIYSWKSEKWEREESAKFFANLVEISKKFREKLYVKFQPGDEKTLAIMDSARVVEEYMEEQIREMLASKGILYPGN